MNLIDLSRWQFAITVMFHMTFPAITVGLSVLLCVLYGMHWRTGSPIYLQMFRFWRRIFAVGFAIGVVAGIVLTFQMGLNWAPYASQTGPIIAPIIGMEVVTAFVVEAGFIGVLLYGDGRVSQRTMFAATVMVAIGTLLSSSWIIAANSLVKGRVLPFARRTVSIGLGVAAIFVPLQIFVVTAASNAAAGQHPRSVDSGRAPSDSTNHRSGRPRRRAHWNCGPWVARGCDRLWVLPLGV